MDLNMSLDKKFPEYGNDYSFPQFELKVLESWKKRSIFEKTVDEQKNKPTFFFYDGPPFATGLPHYGHLLAGTIKDIVPRFWTMKGYRVPRRFGWDTHGLPVEFEMEKTLGLSGSLAIQDYGVAKFNEACRGIVLRYTEEWKKVVDRMGRWIDMENDYKTMDPEFMESVWWVFKELWNKGLIYEGKKVVPYSWRLTAPLSNFEASLNYKDVQDPAIAVVLPLYQFKGAEISKSEVSKTALLVWTTTPWTLPSNLAVAIHPDSSVVSYARYKLAKPLGDLEFVILAKNLAEKWGLAENFVNDVSNASLIGSNYEPLFSLYQDETRKKENAFRVVAGDFVAAEEGTGLVHMAPAFGEDDYFVCAKEKISLVDPTDMQASFTSEVTKDPRLSSIVGVFVKDADKTIIKVLKDSNRLFKQDVLQHAYPFCERSDTPLIYKAISSWFVKVENLKEVMIENNKKIHWVPGHIKTGRFGKWIENARDWCISRNRFWGTPIPVWKCQSCKHVEVVGSRAELNKLGKKEFDDLHMHFVDQDNFDCPKCSAKKSLKRTPEVLDCWFESGSMPYAQSHYPFENKENFEKCFPADFIAEGLDQTRGWFYTLTVLAAALFGKPAFQNCIVNGMVLAEDGKKMSKRLRNYPDPNEIFSKYGADALRLYLMQSPAMHAEDLRFSEKGLVELMRAVMLPLWNAYSFFASYANIDNWTVEKIQKTKPPVKTPILDKWILARVAQTEMLVDDYMKKYELSEVAPVLVSLIDDLTNWYIRLNRDRFWAENTQENFDSKSSAYFTLWSCLNRLSILMAPFLPFFAEIIYSALRSQSMNELSQMPTSVHQQEFGFGSVAQSEIELVQKIELAKRIIVLGRSLRAEAKIGIRQPLQSLRVAGVTAQQISWIDGMIDLIKDELNIKSVSYVAKASDLVEESVKPNHRVIGKKVGGSMKAIQAELEKWGPAEISAFESKKSVSVLGFELGVDDITVVRKAKPGKFAQSERGLVAELDTQLSPELIKEGIQRECVNRIQQTRKDLKFHLADRIRIQWTSNPGSLVEAIMSEEAKKRGIISGETLALEVTRVDRDNHSTKENFGEHGLFEFTIEKIT
jgi:isoleucyl-tRNA synthetase